MSSSLEALAAVFISAAASINWLRGGGALWTADELSIMSNIQSFRGRAPPSVINSTGRRGVVRIQALTLYNQPRAQRKVRVSLSLSNARAERDYMVIGLVPLVTDARAFAMRY